MARSGASTTRSQDKECVFIVLTLWSLISLSTRRQRCVFVLYSIMKKLLIKKTLNVQNFSASIFYVHLRSFYSLSLFFFISRNNIILTVPNSSYWTAEWSHSKQCGVCGVFLCCGCPRLPLCVLTSFLTSFPNLTVYKARIYNFSNIPPSFLYLTFFCSSYLSSVIVFNILFQLFYFLNLP